MSHLSDLRDGDVSPDEAFEIARERFDRRVEDLYAEYVWELAQLLDLPEDAVGKRF